MSAATTSTTNSSTSVPKISAVRLQALVTTWSITGFVVFGIAWALGLEADWWQRLVLALPVAGLAVLDAYDIGPVIEFRARLTHTLADLNWVQVPLAIAGAAWLLGLMPGVGERLVIGALIVLVAVLYNFAPHAAAPAGGAR
ncbi:hypothetical protein [Streptomyces lutosisoli]|uniref:SPW repeat-containing protein n=1 Tax=Streptomyces lutosisoli TaxID=2665721 RepID=A0ABW2VT72_9ACTN